MKNEYRISNRFQLATSLQMISELEAIQLGACIRQGIEGSPSLQVKQALNKKQGYFHHGCVC